MKSDEELITEWLAKRQPTTCTTVRPKRTKRAMRRGKWVASRDLRPGGRLS